MILLVFGAIFALELFLIPYIRDYAVKLLAKKPNKDSSFMLLKDMDDNIRIQFSNNNGKDYHDYDDTVYRSESSAKSELDGIISRMNKTEKVLFEYSPNRLRITDGSEKEFQEEDTL